MNKLILSWGWYLIFGFHFCALDASQKLVEEASTQLKRTSEESLADRLKALEIFTPLTEDYYRTRSRIEDSELGQKPLGKVIEWFTRGRKMQQLSNLVEGAQGYSDATRSIADKLRTMVKDHEFPDQLFIEGSGLQNIIISALENLQEENLQTNERLWNLSVLHILQSYLPRGQFKPIREDLSSGPVSRGGLELFLTKGLDCKPRVDASTNGIAGFPVNKSVTEALKRVELILTIKHVLQDVDTERTAFRHIHDLLLKKRYLSKATVKRVAHLVCFGMIGVTKYTQAHCLFQTLEHLEAFYPTTRQFLKGKKGSGETYGSFKERVWSAAQVKHHIGKHLEESNVDPYVYSMLVPVLQKFTYWQSLPLDYIDYIKDCICSLKIQDSALKRSKSEEYNLDISKKERYFKDQDFFIHIMFIASPCIEGLREYLQSQVKQDGKSGHYQFISELVIEDKSELPKICAICQHEFMKEQKVVKLGCNFCSQHFFHEECMIELPSKVLHGHNYVSCPLCRKQCSKAGNFSLVWK